MVQLSEKEQLNWLYKVVLWMAVITIGLPVFVVVLLATFTDIEPANILLVVVVLLFIILCGQMIWIRKWFPYQHKKYFKRHK